MTKRHRTSLRSSRTQGGASPPPAAVQNSPENILHVAGRASNRTFFAGKASRRRRKSQGQSTTSKHRSELSFTAPWRRGEGKTKLISFLGEGRPKGELEEKEKKIGNGGRREGPSFYVKERRKPRLV